MGEFQCITDCVDAEFAAASFVDQTTLENCAGQCAVDSGGIAASTNDLLTCINAFSDDAGTVRVCGHECFNL